CPSPLTRQLAAFLRGACRPCLARGLFAAAIPLDVDALHAQYVNVSYIHMRSTMSGWANQGTYGNTGSPWGPGAQPGWNPPWDAWRCWHAAKPLWIAAMVLGFIFWWPVGLALLFLGIWGKRMAFGGCGGWQRASGNGWYAQGGPP